VLGDRVLQGLAWKLAEQLGWHDTFVAEYLALTRLQSDAFVTLDAGLARAARGVVAVAALDDVLAGVAIQLEVLASNSPSAGSARYCASSSSSMPIAAAASTALPVGLASLRASSASRW
jgi:hypothetical protein